MADITNPDIEAYAADHSSREPDLLAELAAATRQFSEAHGMMVGHLEGRFLKMLAAISGARRILEIARSPPRLPRSRSAQAQGPWADLHRQHALVGEVLDQTDRSRDTVALRELNYRISRDPRVECVMCRCATG